MQDIFLSIGSNLGEREENISKAVLLLNNALKIKPSAISSIIESPSWGFSGPDFLDCVVKYSSDIDPFRLLEICKGIEFRMGRRETVEYDSNGDRIYHDRIIDIDILTVGDLKIDTPELKIPHPQMQKRDFILRCLAEIGQPQIVSRETL